MLNLWIPFIVNRIRIISISENFNIMDVCLQNSFWNRNPNKSVWGGAIASAIDPFFQILMKQILLRKDIATDFYSKSISVNFLKKVNSDINFKFIIKHKQIDSAQKALLLDGKYSEWYHVDGIDLEGNVCVKGEVQIFLRKR
mgnify:FL=1|tara:strand:- start:893 stop:1318 length:426 start_codon:yes stop_codon:yes gene_type:complete